MCSMVTSWDLRQNMLATTGQTAGTFSNSANAATRGRRNNTYHGGQVKQQPQSRRQEQRRDDPRGRQDQRVPVEEVAEEAVAVAEVALPLPGKMASYAKSARRKATPLTNVGGATPIVMMMMMM
jgi:hypothetical protein